MNADIEGYQVDLEDHQDTRELQLYAGCFVTEPKVDPPLDAKGNPVKNAPEVEWVAPEDAPVGYMWAQTGPIVNGEELLGNIGIVPLQRLKRIEKDCLRKAHDASGVTATNIIKKIAVSEEVDGLWTEFYIHRTIEPTFKIDRKYANPKNPAKKFIGGFTFEDSEFLLDQQEPLKDHCLRMTKLDGTSGRVKPRNLQQIEEAWGLPHRLPVESSGTKKKPTSAPRTSSDKTSLKYQYKPGINGKDFAIKNLRQHCQARGYVAKEYGRTKETLWVKDYEGRVGRIDEDNLEPINGAWELDIDQTRFNQGIMSAIRKKAGYGKPPKKPKKLASNKPDPKVKTPVPKAKTPDTKATGKKRPASEPAGPDAKKIKTDTSSKAKIEELEEDKAKELESEANDPFKDSDDDDDDVAPLPAIKAGTVPKKALTKKATPKKTPNKRASIEELPST
ncbi:hypothetical protein DID88_000653 [Monilinia fructigena]|uniref:Uncharacterized protein n=1 Tax=Monilinia fructigena TaxID=38457 RepID=A0A395II69_9HELO|nr:hypothetical protein DID88_000653 [Monilinia fructigena]